MSRNMLLLIVVISLSCFALGKKPAAFVGKISTPQDRHGASTWGDDVIPVYVNLGETQNSIGSHFIGVTIDSDLVKRDFATLDFSSKKVQNLARGLSPSFMRLGGTAADCMNFVPETPLPSPQPFKNRCTNSPKNLTSFNITVTQWDMVNKFAQSVGFDFIMDLNVLHRDTNDRWSSDNTRQLLDYSASKNYPIAGFELGNEYDEFQHAFTYELSASRLAEDYKSLRTLLGEYPLYASSIILGPETATSNEQYFKAFLEAGGADVVNASTFHQYYFAGGKSVVGNFTDVRNMDKLGDTLVSTLNQSHSVKPSLPVWLSETSSSYNGGTPNVSDRFVAGFLWLDKLGLCAEMGIEVVLRQDFYGGNYALLDVDLNPNPDYWVTLLYKQLVSGPVYKVSKGLPVRMYAAGANPKRFGSGAVVWYYLNPSDSSKTLFLPQSSGKFLLYILTPGDNDGLTSKFIALNGAKIEMNGDELPELEPYATNSSIIKVPSYSFGFIVAPKTV